MRRGLRTLTAVALAALVVAGVSSAENYIVLYKQESVGGNAAKSIQLAGGALLYSYDQIGVAIASSSNPSFRDNLLLRDNSVENASPTSGFAVRLDDTESAEGPPAGDLPNAPASDADTFSGFQWDMQQIKSPEAHAITGGSRTVLVGDIDTGLDYRHPDLRQNVDSANSVNCLGGVPTPGAAAADDDHGHGTHTAGTVAAAANGIGIVGVAPNVRIAGIKAATAEGYFFPEAIVCSFMWAGSRQFDVTNNSYFADPYLFNCRNDPVQHAIWKAESRAIRYAQSQGVSVVAAEGNFRDDLAHPTRDVISPDFPPGSEEERAIRNNCVVIPVEVSGVIGVTATGVRRQKSSYSNYGVGVTDVAAPGGDAALQPTTDPGRGRVLSTWPASRPCGRSRQEPTGDPTYPIAFYCWIQGTSMASPHVAGLAGLVISRYGDFQNPQNGKLRPGRVSSLIEQTADPTPCPDDVTPYAPFPSVANGAPQTCQGGTGYNSWYGKGIINALSAVTHTP